MTEPRRRGDRERLLAVLRELGAGVVDPEAAHLEADRALLDDIGDDEVRHRFDAVDTWYA